jgi:hypothetical protein
VSEIAIVIGTVGIIVGGAAKVAPALLAGVIVCTLAVAEFSAREHFSGYRSHTLLLAAIPAVAVGAAVVALVGGSVDRSTIIFVVVPIFAILALFLRKRFRTARHSRTAGRVGR